ncbi:MAG: hypothetical protein V4501_12215 [Pseudomonadota bacterium]
MLTDTQVVADGYLSISELNFDETSALPFVHSDLISLFFDGKIDNGYGCLFNQHYDTGTVVFEPGDVAFWDSQNNYIYPSHFKKIF